jgi:gliding motility-associated-like protein
MKIAKRIILSLFLSFLFQILWINSQAQCSSLSLKVNNDKGCSPLIVKFTTSGAPSGSTYHWDFGSGAYVKAFDTSNKVFIKPGTYNCHVAVKFPNGTKCTLTQSIIVNATPIPNIKVSPKNAACFGTKNLSFTDSSTGGSTWDWLIDGISYSGQTIGVKFKTNGVKSLALKVTNSLGCSGLFNNSSFINIGDSGGADFCASIVQDKTGSSVTYNPLIYAGSRSIIKYAWSFPGGTPSSDTNRKPISVIKYSGLSGSYGASFSFTTSDGCVYKQTYSGLVSDYIIVKTDSACYQGNVFLAKQYTNGGRNQFGWLLSDGLVSYGSPYDTARFSTSGFKDIVLGFKYGSNGCVHTVTQNKRVKIFGPIADFNAKSKFICSLKDTVHLYSISDTFGNTSLTYKWEITDSLGSSISGSPFITKTKFLDTKLPKVGKYTVRLTVKGDKGCQDTITKKGYLFLRSPKADYLLDTNQICLGKSAKFTANPTPPDDKKNPYNYLWQFENADSTSLSYTLTNKEVKFGPNNPGTYNLALVIVSGKTCSDTLRVKKVIKINGITAKLKIFGPSGGCPPTGGTASLRSLKFFPPSISNQVKYTWTFDKLKTGDTFNVTSDTTSNYKINNSDCYSIKVVMRDSNKCESKAAGSIGCFGLKAKFTIDANNCLGKSTNISNQATNNPDRYKWEIFPKSSGRFVPSDTDANPTMVYTKDTIGITIRQTVYKTFAGVTCSDFHDTLIPFLNVPKVIAYAKVKTAFCAPVLVDFVNHSILAKTYVWDFGDGIIMNYNDTALSHVYTKNNPNGFKVTITATDSAGCVVVGYLQDTLKIIGPVPKIIAKPKIGCDSLTVMLRDSNINVKKFITDYDDGTPLDSNTIKNHFYKITSGKDSAIFNPIIVAVDDKNCKNYDTTVIKLYKTPIPKFTATNNKGCPPLNVVFNNSSTSNIVRQEWDFNNDGIVDDTAKTPTYIYKDSGSFTVKLTTYGKGGCSQSILQKDLVVVSVTPIPDFTFDKIASCGNDSIQIFNNSKFYVSYKIDYGNGNTDSNKLSKQYYAFKGLTPYDSTIYPIKLSLQSRSGCSSSLTKNLIAYPALKIKTSFGKTQGCAPLNAQVTDLTPLVISRIWDLNSDGSVDDTFKIFKKSLLAGDYNLSLVVKNRGGCKDSQSYPLIFNSYQIPTANFEVSDTLICPNSPIQFKFTGVNQIGLNFKYNLDEKGKNDSVLNQKDISYLYAVAGKHYPSLTLTSDKGCKDTFVLPNPITVRDTISKQKTEMNYVSVNPIGQIQIGWNKDTLDLIKRYQVNRLSALKLLGDSFFTTNYNYLDVESRLETTKTSYSYQILREGICNQLSLKGKIHSSILLKVSNIGQRSLDLQWSPYIGVGVTSYQIWRKKASDTGFKPIYNTSNLSFTDSLLCNDSLTYFIAAQLTNGFVSTSNRLRTINNFPLQLEGIRLNYASVVGDEKIELKWSKYAFDKYLKNYILERADSNSNKFVRFDSISLPSNFILIDDKVDVHNKKYQYRIKSQDVCGNFSPYSNIASNILLKGYLDNDLPKLYWNPYQYWPEGVKQYDVYYKDDQNNLKFLQSLYNNDSNFTLIDVLPNVTGKYCFTLQAISGNTNKVEQSTSNEFCLTLDSRVFIPNAFTPNGDGLNDEFKPNLLSINSYKDNPYLSYSFRIFNRWGTEVFQTDNPSFGWNGYFKGDRVPLDVYIYTVRAKAFDGKFYLLKGNIQVLY